MLSSASQAEIMAPEFFLCIHEVIAFLVFSIYFMFVCDSKNFALQYPSFPSINLILSSIKLLLFLGLRCHCLQPSSLPLNTAFFPMSKI